MSSLWTEIREALMTDPESVAVAGLDGRDSISGGELVQQVEALKSEIAGLPPGPIALLADNSPSWIIADLASLAAGKCLLPLPTFFSDAQIVHALNDAGAVQVLADRPLPTSVAGFNIKGRRLGNTPYTLLTRSGAISSIIPPGTLKITYTSGSTGAPKGVCLGDAQVGAVARSLAAALVDSRVTRHLCAMPLATLLENVAGVYVPLLLGIEIVVPVLPDLGFLGSSGIDANMFCSAISASQAQSMILTPQLLDLLLRLASVGRLAPDQFRFIAVGGARVSPALIARAGQLGLPVCEGYGLSECGSVVSLNTPNHRRVGSAGRPLDHVSVSLDDGEILVHGNSFLGYCGDPDSFGMTACRTGDLGYLDDEGFLYINGRSKNLLISSFGRNISPEWIESELAAIPGVRQCVVFGEARPYCTALIFADARITDAALDSDIQLLNSRLPDYGRLGGWHRMQLPFSTADGTLTGNGRLRRDVIADLCSDIIESLYQPNPVPAPARPLHTTASTVTE